MLIQNTGPEDTVGRVMVVELRGMFPLGVAILTMVSGILTAVSALPLLNLPHGSIRDQNFVPITGQLLAYLALGFVVVGLVMIAAGLVFLALPRWRVIPSSIALLLSTPSFLANASTTVLVIPSTMGVLGGLLGILSIRESSTRKPPISGENWLTAFPFLLTGVGLWEFGGLFLGCGPPNGIGTGGCDLLGRPFYIIFTLGLAALLSFLSTPLWKALRYVMRQSKGEANSAVNSLQSLRRLVEPFAVYSRFRLERPVEKSDRLKKSECAKCRRRGPGKRSIIQAQSRLQARVSM